MMRDFELEAYFSKWEFAAKYHLTASDIEAMSLSELLAYASAEDRDAFNNLWLGYTETWGSPDLREEIADTYDVVQANEILCFAGAEEGVYVAMRALLESDDHAIVAVPNYQAAETIPLDICEVSGVPLDPDNGWTLDLDALKAALRPNTRVISINFPNNPTGGVMPLEDFAELVDICEERNIYLFSDEVYRLVERDESLRMPQAADAYSRGLSLNVMSKAYGLPGLRIGWIACRDRSLLRKMERYKHYLSICNSAPSEMLAIIALKAREQILKRNRELLDVNRRKLADFFADYPGLFDSYDPPGSCVAWPRFLGNDVNEFCEDLVDTSGVLLLPPRIYHSELLPIPEDRFRIGFGRRNLPQCLDAFRDYIENHYQT